MIRKCHQKYRIFAARISSTSATSPTHKRTFNLCMLYNLTIFQTFYLVLYIFQILYSALLGFWMFAYKDSPDCPHGEMVAKRRMTRAVGCLMFVWTFDLLIYLLPMLYSSDLYSLGNKVCFFATTMMSTVAFHVVMCTILQKMSNMLRKACILGIPFLLIGVWYVVTGQTSMLPIYIDGCIFVVCIVFLLFKHIPDYRDYINRLRSEYSDATSRDILWAWWCFLGLAIQLSLFVAYQFYWSITIEFIYTGIVLVNATCICYCTQKHKPLDNDIVEETVEETLAENQDDVPQEEKVDDKAFYSIIEQKLESQCEKNLLFLEPDLTRESLCQRLSIGRTYLGMYLRSRGLTFHQYINSLRVEYAVKLMWDNPEIPVREVSSLSGFRSQTTFRKMFQEVMGCLPSEMKPNNYTVTDSKNINQ